MYILTCKVCEMETSKDRSTTVKRYTSTWGCESSNKNVFGEDLILINNLGKFKKFGNLIF